MNIVYPRRIFYGSTEPVPLDISISCILPCTVTPELITVSSQPSLLLSADPDSQDWSTTISGQLAPNGAPLPIYLKQSSSPLEDGTLNIKLSVFQDTLNNIHIESEWDALARLAFTEAWVRSPVVISIISLVAGWLLKQNEDDNKKKNEQLDRDQKEAERHQEIDIKEEERLKELDRKSFESLKEKIKTAPGLADWLKEY